MTPLEQAGDVDRTSPDGPIVKQLRTMTEYLVYCDWRDGKGGATVCKTMAAAQASAANHVGSQYAKGYYSIRIEKVTRTIWEYKP